MTRALPAVLAVLMSSCIPASLVERIASVKPGCLYSVPRTEKVVALTLDDGPDSTTPPALLSILARNDARATFFLISGNLPGNDTLVRRLVREGHEIGNHLTRDEASISLSPREF